MTLGRPHADKLFPDVQMAGFQGMSLKQCI